MPTNLCGQLSRHRPLHQLPGNGEGRLDKGCSLCAQREALSRSLVGALIDTLSLALLVQPQVTLLLDVWTELALM